MWICVRRPSRRSCLIAMPATPPLLSSLTYTVWPSPAPPRALPMLSAARWQTLSADFLALGESVGSVGACPADQDRGPVAPDFTEGASDGRQVRPGPGPGDQHSPAHRCTCAPIGSTVMVHSVPQSRQ